MSISSQIESNKNAYYAALQQGQQSNDINSWLIYFSEVIINAQQNFNELIAFTIKKTRFFDNNKAVINDRQQKVIQRMLEEGEDGFKGGINTRKYVVIANTSRATAIRDLQDLVAKSLLTQKGGGRSVGYQVNL